MIVATMQNNRILYINKIVLNNAQKQIQHKKGKIFCKCHGGHTPSEKTEKTVKSFSRGLQQIKQWNIEVLVMKE